MPCYDERSDPKYIRKEIDEKWQKKVDELTSMLCLMCRCVEATEIFTLPQSILPWWKKHKKFDKSKKKKGK